jgi:predicted ArsR family transcriptional regulator
METTGREIGRELVGETARDGDSSLEMMLAALGFQPSPRAGEKGTLTFSLGNCPYRDAVSENQPAVCALHKGLTQGMLEQLEPGASLTAFTPHDPERAGCVIEVQGSRALAGT